MNAPFSQTLQTLRANAKLTNNELARLADVPESLISGLQNDHRRVGEYQAMKIGKALKLAGDELEDFVYAAINTCTEKVLNHAKPYPSQLLNLLAVQLHRAGIPAESIYDFSVGGDEHGQDVTLTLGSGKTATLKTQLVCV
jgi:transcriptional regulator with XRE-family HTH domain